MKYPKQKNPRLLNSQVHETSPYGFCNCEVQETVGPTDLAIMKHRKQENPRILKLCCTGNKRTHKFCNRGVLKIREPMK